MEKDIQSANFPDKGPMKHELKILLIEDDEDDFVLVREMLSSLSRNGYEVDWIQNWKDGLAAIKQNRHDICLLDYCLGARDGIELVEEAIAGRCSIPIVLLTGHGGREIDLRAMRAGAADYLDKNKLTPALLDRAIRYSLVRIKAQQLQAKRTDDSITSILLIEDDEDDYLITKDLLDEIRGDDFVLDWVKDWEAGLSEIDARAHDVYLVDYRLGQRTGLELVEEANARGCTAPFILLTGQDSREVDLEAMKVGAADYLVKGQISGHLLDRAIRYAIERNRGEQRLAELAQYDQLTGLANRSLFSDYLAKALSRANRSQRTLAVMFLDLDRFKVINDTFGHNAGDLLLKEVALRLKDCVRTSDLVARLGGDEFTVVVDGILDPDMIGHFGERILHALKQPFSLGDNQVFTSASIGIAVYPFDADNIEDLLKSADVAMYRAKEQGTDNFQFYTMDLHVKATKYLSLERDLRRAMEREEFCLWYQPQLDLKSRRVTGFEALIRWEHPEQGLVGPNKFIPLAEESGLIVPIGEWALRTACHRAMQWRYLTKADISIAVNFSARQFQERDLRQRVSEIIEECGLPPHLLDIEITESSILKNPEQVRLLLEEFTSMGLRVSLDDFGTGYSSLNHLRSFPGASIKIDRSFIINICENPDDAAIVKATIQMAHNLRLRVIAEGVETAEQFEFLVAHNCDGIQGYFFSRPLAADKIGPELFDDHIEEIARSSLAVSLTAP